MKFKKINQLKIKTVFFLNDYFFFKVNDQLFISINHYSKIKI